MEDRETQVRSLLTLIAPPGEFGGWIIAALLKDPLGTFFSLKKRVSQMRGRQNSPYSKKRNGGTGKKSGIGGYSL